MPLPEMPSRMRRAVLWAVAWGALAASGAVAQDTPPAEPPAGTPVPPTETPPTPPAEAPPTETPPTPPAEAPPAAPPPGQAPPVVPPPGEAPPAAEPAPAPPPEPTPPPEPYVPPSAVPAASPPVQAVDSGEPAESEPAVEEKEKLRWRRSVLLWDHAVSKNTFSEGAQQSYNPTYLQTLSVRPRWYFTDSLSLRLIQDLEVELTESDSTTYQNQVLFDDTRFDLVEGKIAEIEKVDLSVGGTLRLPLSLASRAQGRIVSLGPLVGASREFPVLHGLTFALDGAYRHNFATRNVPATDEPYPCRLVGGELSTGCDQASGVTNVEDVLGVNLDASLAVLDELSFTIGGGLQWARGAAKADARYEDFAVGATGVIPQNGTSWRNLTDVHASVGYEPVAWAGLEFGFSTLTAHEDIGGAAGRNPIFHADTMLSLTLTVAADELYLALRDEEGS